MFEKKYGVASAVTLALLMTGCGGGGGGGDTVTPTPTPVATTTTQSVSGSVTLSSLVSGAAATAAAEATTAATTTAATVTVRSYAADGTLTETKQLVAGDEGLFSTQITLHTTAAGGGYVVIDVKSPNTSGWSKRINYTDPEAIDINAELRVAQTVVQSIATDSVFSPSKASAEDGVFSFGVVRYTDGTRKAVAGKAAITAAKAADGTAGMDLEIDIPSAELPDTETLKANLLTFDPSDPVDARNFPGAYMDSTGNPLVSVAFDSIEITDDAGSSVADLAATALAAGTASKAAATGVTVRRYIPGGACQSVGDFWSENVPDGAASGSTIPIYTYNPVKGNWDLLGTGTVQSYSTDTGLYTDVATFDSETCLASAYYLNIAISSEDYINAWWNLDYPLLTSAPTEVCVDLTFTDNATTPAPLSGIYAELSGADISRVSGGARSDGTLRLSSIVTGTGTTPTTGTVSYYNPYDYSYQTVAAVPVGSSPTCSTKTIAVTKPRICSVTGTVTKSGSPVANEYVWAYSSNPYAYGWAYTGTNGTFSTNVRCDVEMDLYVGSTLAKTFKVDYDSTPTDEVSDDGSVVALGTIAKANAAPYAYGYLSSYSVKTGTAGTANVTAYVYSWDADGATDYPLSYVVKVNGTAATDGTGSIVPADDFKPVSLTLAANATAYTITADITDQAGATTTITVGSVEVVSGNRKPVISYAYPSSGSVRLNKDGTLPSLSLYGYAYDPDGVALASSGWSCSGCQVALSTGNNITFTDTNTYSEGVLTFTYTAVDGVANTLTATRDVYVEILPYLNSTPYFTTVSPSDTTVTAVPVTVTLTAAAADSDVGDTLTYTWKVDGVADTSATGSSYTLTVPTGAVDGTTYTVVVEVTDGIATISKTFTVTYATVSSDTTIILQ